MFRFISIMMLVAFSQSAGAAMYKWVDEKGVTQYGDTLPPQYVNQGSAELNQRGQVVKKTTRAVTEEERKALEADTAKKIEENKKEMEQKRRDKALIDTYSSEKEIELGRDRNLQATQAQIDSTQVRIKSIQTRLDGLRKQADPLIKARKPVPADLAAEIKATEDEIKRLQESITKRKQEIDAINIRCEEDKKRYRELKGYQPAAPNTATPAPAPAKTTK